MRPSRRITQPATLRSSRITRNAIIVRPPRWPLVLVLATLFSCLNAAGAVAAGYNVVVHTSGNVTGAGTDASIYITLYGADGAKAGPYKLSEKVKGNVAQKGDVDAFYVSDKDIGYVEKVLVRTTGKASGTAGSAWHLHKVFVNYIKDTSRYSKGYRAASNKAAFLENERNSGNLVESTFTPDMWIRGNEKTTFGGKQIDGEMLNREEKKLQELGGKKVKPSRLYKVYVADALDDSNAVEQDFTSIVTVAESLKLETASSNSTSIGTSVGYGWEPGDAGGNAFSVALSIEHESLKSSLKSEDQTITDTAQRVEKFKANPGTLTFRILQGSGQLITQEYRSLIGNGRFTANYATARGDLHAVGVSFTKNKLDNDRWNNSVAKPLYQSLGKVEYQKIRQRLTDYGCLNADAWTAEQALNQIR